MRCEYLKKLLPNYDFTVADIDIPLNATSRLFRSIGWRFRKGPLIVNINKFIEQVIRNNYSYDLVWVDKGVFIKPEIVHKLKANSHRLVHFTPDPAFTYHRSQLFYNALDQYDYCVTTKSYELEEYKRYGVKTILCTQGYDPEIHRPYHHVDEKEGVVFIGHREEEREYIISMLVEKNIQVTIAGNHWEKFAAKRKYASNLVYLGKGLFGVDYARELSKAMLGLGLLSKWVPELHTTRTFEIPACRTVLITERNSETTSIYSQNEAVFYSKPSEVIALVQELLSDREKAQMICENGYKKVSQGDYSYPLILKKILKEIIND
jgi:spore maturation protein CgeB